MADRGKEDSTMYQKKGLAYTALDDHGNKIGTPIKASAFYSKPTLAFLEEKFRQNEMLRQSFKKYIKNYIDLAIMRGANNLERLVQDLQKKGVSVVIRQNNEGTVYGLTYIDHINKTVFNGSDLGKDYSAKAIMDKFQDFQDNSSNQLVDEMDLKTMKLEEENVADEIKKTINHPYLELLKPVRESTYIPSQLLKKKRGKKMRLRL